MAGCQAYIYTVYSCMSYLLKYIKIKVYIQSTYIKIETFHVRNANPWFTKLADGFKLKLYHHILWQKKVHHNDNYLKDNVQSRMLNSMVPGGGYIIYIIANVSIKIGNFLCSILDHSMFKLYMKYNLLGKGVSKNEPQITTNNISCYLYFIYIH